MKEKIIEKTKQEGCRAGERALGRLVGALLSEGRWSEITDVLNHSCLRDWHYGEMGILKNAGCEKYVPALAPDTIEELRSVGVDPVEAEVLCDEVYREGWITGETRMRILSVQLIRSCQTDVIDLTARDDEIREIFFTKYKIGMYAHTSEYPGGALLTQEALSRAKAFEDIQNSLTALLDLPSTIGAKEGDE